MIKVGIVADSINARTQDRLTTFLLTYPRYIHAELMTHRVFSRNAASSRAIPSAKFRMDVTDNPVIPSHWGANRPGMQAGEELDDILQDWLWPALDFTADIDIDGSAVPRSKISQRECAKKIWMAARDFALKAHVALGNVGLHKQIANRILEPWFHIEVLVSATEYDNWFGLRCHKDAHPDIQILSDAMLEMYVTREPKPIIPGEWHLPFGDQDIPESMSIDDKLKICVARAARVSYKNFDGEIDFEADFALHDRLKRAGHWSPFEHPARALKRSCWSGNFCGFEQYRKLFTDESRVIEDLRAFWEQRKKERGLATLIP